MCIRDRDKIKENYPNRTMIVDDVPEEDWRRFIKRVLTIWVAANLIKIFCDQNYLYKI